MGRWRRTREPCRQEILSTCLQEQLSPSRWVMREGGKFILTVHRNGFGEEGVFAEGTMLHELFHSQEKETGPELENKGGVSYWHQPLHTITPTAKPVFIHCGNDMKHFPTLEAQLVRSCGSVVTESPDCPGGVKERKDEGTRYPALPRPYCPVADGPCWFIQQPLILEEMWGHLLTC